MTKISDTWCPVVLPHVETSADRLRFMGRELEASDQVSDDDAALLSRCDGSRPLDGFNAADRETIGRWRHHGLLLMAPPLSPGHAGAALPVVVSPHPDDAALALGGTVARQSGRFLDVFSVETWTKDPYYAELPEVTRRLLLAEEEVAARVLRAEVELLGFVDAADRDLRRHHFFAETDWSDESVWEERELFEAITERLVPFLDGVGHLFVPLGVGGHVDHLACREAVLDLARRGALDGARIAFYEDQPYSLFSSAEETATKLSARLAEAGLGELHPELLPMDDTAALTKSEALGAYRIQVRKGIIRRIGRHGVRMAEGSPFPAAERVWLMRRG